MSEPEGQERELEEPLALWEIHNMHTLASSQILKRLVRQNVVLRDRAVLFQLFAGFTLTLIQAGGGIYNFQIFEKV
jgi:hypothetical protein